MSSVELSAEYAMPSSVDHKTAILDRVADALALIPGTREPDLPPSNTIPDVPAWHGYEHKIWALGEEVRQIVNTKPALRGDRDLFLKFLRIVEDRAAKRGRQSWILLFSCRPCGTWAHELAKLLSDPDIDGHVIAALYKMKVAGFSELVLQFRDASITWVRKGAIRYLEFDKGSE
jgi:hypothetical protein